MGANTRGRAYRGCSRAHRHSACTANDDTDVRQLMVLYMPLHMRTQILCIENHNMLQNADL
jgi:hypothetical protein